MLDRWTIELVKPPLTWFAKKLQNYDVHPDRITLVGFLIGLLSLPALANENYGLALLFILVNRFADGLDGALARLIGATDGGGYLDITLDFIFYPTVVLGFAFADPEHNALVAAALITSFMATGSSFLAFAVMAEKNNIENIRLPNKGLYYINGLAEGTETILFFVLACLFPAYFPILAWSFFVICIVTTITRVYGGFKTLQGLRSQ